MLAYTLVGKRTNSVTTAIPLGMNFCADSVSGSIFGVFSNPGNYTATLTATDPNAEVAGAAVVERYRFTVVPAKFKVNVSDARMQPLQGGKHTDPDANTQYVVGTNYRIMPRRLLERGTVPSTGTFTDSRFTIENAPDGWFVNAMTGEISLRGLVLPIGGVKEKVLAAVRAGITTILLPSRNQRDLEDVPEAVRDSVKFIWMNKVEDAIAAALGPVTKSIESRAEAAVVP